MTTDMPYLAAAFICAYGIILFYDAWLDLRSDRCGESCGEDSAA